MSEGSGETGEDGAMSGHYALYTYMKLSKTNLIKAKRLKLELP